MTFSDEALILAARHKAYRKERSERKKQELMAEVRQAVRELDASGTYPSWRKVWARLQPTTGKCFWDCITAYQEAKRELGYEHWEPSRKTEIKEEITQ